MAGASEIESHLLLIRPSFFSSPSYSVTPSASIEGTVARIWADVFGAHELDPGEDFFELGGNSLLATQITSRVRGECGVELTARSLFDKPTLAAFTQGVIAATKRDSATSHPAEPEHSRNERRMVSSSEERMWFLHQLDKSGAAYNVPGIYRLTGPLDRLALEDSVNEIVRRHDILRATFTLEDGELVRTIEPSLRIELPVFDVPDGSDREREDAVKQMATAHAKQPFELSRPPLLRAVLLRSSATDHALVLTSHHMVSDSWSAGVFLRELATLYARLLPGANALAARAAPSVCRLRRLAPIVAAQRGTAAPARLLDATTRRRTAGAGPAHRSPATGAPGFQWSTRHAGAPGGGVRSHRGTQPSQRGVRVHDPDDGVRGIAVPLHRTTGHPARAHRSRTVAGARSRS